MRTASSWLKSLIVLVATTIILGYAYGRTKDLIEGPAVFIVSPSSGATLAEPLAVIRGRAERTRSITLNGRDIFISKDGQLSEAVVLAPGYNALEFKAGDRFGRTTTVNIALVYRDHPTDQKAASSTAAFARAKIPAKTLPMGRASTTTAQPSQGAPAGEASSTLPQAVN